jgi:hypothetical protein
LLEDRRVFETFRVWSLANDKQARNTKSLAGRGFLREEEKKEKRRKIGFLRFIVLAFER